MADNKWVQPDGPPPPLFLGQKERDYTKQVNDEVIERVIGQQVLYYPISFEKTNFHPIYGEAVEKTFLPPVRIHALVELDAISTYTTNYGLDKEAKIVVNFHKRRLTEDQDMFVREGDFVCYGDRFYEIVSLSEPRELFGQAQHRFEISAVCIQARKGLFTRPEPTAFNRIRSLVGESSGNGGTENQQPSISSNEVQVFCPIPGSYDATVLQQYADNAADHFGKVIYVANVSGAASISPFNQLGKFYFNEVGTWYPSPFIIVPNTAGFDNC